MNKTKKNRSKKKCKGGGIGSSRAKREDNKDESLNNDSFFNESLKTSPKGPQKKTVSFNNTVKKRKSYEDNNSENSEEDDISDKHKKKKKKTPVKWGKNRKEKNTITLTNLDRAKEIAHATNWDNWTKRGDIDRKEYYRRKEEINNQMFM